MSKCHIRAEFECQNRILNVKIRYSAAVRMSKFDIRPENAIFGRYSKDTIRFLMSKFDIRLQFECQNRILNVKMRFSARIRMSK